MGSLSDGACKEPTSQNKLDSQNQLQHTAQSTINQLENKLRSKQLVPSIAVNSPLGGGWTLPVVLSQNSFALVCFPTVPDATGGKTPHDREASAEAVRDNWESREEIEMKDKGRKD